MFSDIRGFCTVSRIPAEVLGALPLVPAKSQIRMSRPLTRPAFSSVEGELIFNASSSDCIFGTLAVVI